MPFSRESFAHLESVQCAQLFAVSASILEIPRRRWSRPPRGFRILKSSPKSLALGLPWLAPRSSASVTQLLDSDPCRLEARCKPGIKGSRPAIRSPAGQFVGTVVHNHGAGLWCLPTYSGPFSSILVPSPCILLGIHISVQGSELTTSFYRSHSRQSGIFCAAAASPGQE